MRKYNDKYDLINGWGDGQEDTDRARSNKLLPYLHTDGQWQWYKGHQDILSWAVRRQKNAKELNKNGPNDMTKNQPMGRKTAEVCDEEQETEGF